MSSRQAGFELLGRNNEGANIAIGKVEDSLPGKSEGIEDALGNALSIISGSIAPESNIWNEAGRRGFFCAGGENKVGWDP